MTSQTIIKVKWKSKDDKWSAQLKTWADGEIKTQDLQKHDSLNIEITNRRRCTGYKPEKGIRKPCPDNKTISKGNQCINCRRNDIYTNYVIGAKTGLKGNFSVYIAQIGDQVKVGVTRTGRVLERWIEQGADYAAQIETGLGSNEAIEREKQITQEHKIKQRINKKDKIKNPESSRPIHKALEKIEGKENKIENVQDYTIYNRPLSNNLKRYGLFKGEIKAVKGKIISNGRLNMVLTPGRTIETPSQNSLDQF